MKFLRRMWSTEKRQVTVRVFCFLYPANQRPATRKRDSFLVDTSGSCIEQVFRYYQAYQFLEK
jgi:hypothetical protein